MFFLRIVFLYIFRSCVKTWTAMHNAKWNQLFQLKPLENEQCKVEFFEATMWNKPKSAKIEILTKNKTEIA